MDIHRCLLECVRDTYAHPSLNLNPVFKARVIDTSIQLHGRDAFTHSINQSSDHLDGNILHFIIRLMFVPYKIHTMGMHELCEVLAYGLNHNQLVALYGLAVTLVHENGCKLDKRDEYDEVPFQSLRAMTHINKQSQALCSRMAKFLTADCTGLEDIMPYQMTHVLRTATMDPFGG